MLLALVGAALATVPFRLPPGEPAEVWAAPLRMADFAPGEAAPDAPYAELREGAQGWELVVRGLDGGVHRAPVPPPVDARAREDIVWMAQSLLDPGVPPFGTAAPVPTPPAPARPPSAVPRASSAPPPVTSPPPLPEPAEPPPVAEPAEPPAPSPPPEVEPPAAPVVAPAPLVDLDAPDPGEPRRLALTAGLAGGAGLREGAAPAFVLAASGGARAGPWTGAVVVTGAAPSALDLDPAIGEGTAAGLRILGVVGLRVERPIGFGAGVGGGVTAYRFREADRPASVVPVPVVVGEVSADVALRPGLAASLALRVGADTRRLRLTVADEPALAWTRAWAEPTIGIVLAR